jgi:hypothetical protein
MQTVFCVDLHIFVCPHVQMCGWGVWLKSCEEIFVKTYCANIQVQENSLQENAGVVRAGIAENPNTSTDIIKCIFTDAVVVDCLS